MYKKYGNLYDWCMEQGERGQRIIEEFIGTDLKNEDYSVTDESWSEWADISIDEERAKIQMMKGVDARSSIKVWWKCKDCNEYYYKCISERVVLIYGCRKCAAKITGKKFQVEALKNDNDLQTWCEQNGEYGQKIIDEWDYAKNRSVLGITMKDVSVHSKLQVFFKCRRCGYEYRKKVGSVTYHRCGCGKCGKQGTSYPEQFLYYALKQVDNETCNREKLFNGYEYDIVIMSRKICIEYNGCYYHKWSKDRDKIKSDLCKENGYRLITIDDDTAYRNREVVYEGDNIKFCYSGKDGDKQIRNVIKYIIEIIGGDFNNIDFNEVERQADKIMYQSVENNVLQKYPALEKEFDSELNNG